MQDCVLYCFALKGVLFLNNRLYGYGRLICYVWIHLLLAATKTKDVSFTCIVKLLSPSHANGIRNYGLDYRFEWR
jgi:hypothetical protein